MHNMPNLICRPEELIRAAGMFGATATTPMLWIYAANDSFFAPDVALGHVHRLRRAGGKGRTLFQVRTHSAWTGTGCSLAGAVQRSGVRPMERYLAARGASP